MLVQHQEVLARKLCKMQMGSGGGIAERAGGCVQIISSLSLRLDPPGKDVQRLALCSPSNPMNL